MYADNIAKRRSDLAGKENDLDARIAFAHGVNEDTQKYNQQLASEINDAAPKVNTLAAQYKNQQITQQQLVAERQNMNKKVQEAENQLRLANEQLDDLKRFRSRQTGLSDALDIEITRLEGQLAQLRVATTTLGALAGRVQAASLAALEGAFPGQEPCDPSINLSIPRQSPAASECISLQSNVNCNFFIDGILMFKGELVRILVTNESHQVICEPEGYEAKAIYVQPPFNPYHLIRFTFPYRDKLLKQGTSEQAIEIDPEHSLRKEIRALEREVAASRDQRNASQRELESQQLKLKQAQAEIDQLKGSTAAGSAERVQSLNEEINRQRLNVKKMRERIAALKAEFQLPKGSLEKPLDELTLIDEILGRMKSANIAFTTPEVMQLGETLGVDLLLGVSAPAKQLKKNASGSGAGKCGK